MENDCPGNVETGASLLSYGDGISDLLELLSGDVLEDGSDQIFTGEIETSSKFELDECGPLYTSELDESLCAKRIKLDSGAAGVIIPTSSDVVEELEDTLEESTAGNYTYEPPPLPEGWVTLQHCSGGTVYFHKASRTCTWARPYTVGTSYTIRKHRVPVHAIPCLEKWLFETEKCELAQKWHENAGGKKGLLIKLEPPKVKEYLLLRWKEEDMSKHELPSAERMSLSVRDKQSELNEMKAGSQVHAQVGNLPSEGNGSGHTKPRKKPVEPAVPEEFSKVVQVQIPKQYRMISAGPDQVKKPAAVWSVNTSNKTPVSILHEFCQHYLKTVPEFSLEETSSKQAPFRSVVSVNGIKYGCGAETTKKQAKQVAAQKTLDLFLPGAFNWGSEAQDISEKAFQYFSNVTMDDPNVVQMLKQVGLPSPWEILKECYQRNQGTLFGELEFSLTPIAGDQKQQFEYKLECGKANVVRGQCSGRREGQQSAAQAMLKELHPYVSSWSTILQMYTDKYAQITGRKVEPANTSVTAPITSDADVLGKLHQEMQKLAMAMKEKGIDMARKHLEL